LVLNIIQFLEIRARKGPASRAPGANLVFVGYSKKSQDFENYNFRNLHLNILKIRFLIKYLSDEKKVEHAW